MTIPNSFLEEIKSHLIGNYLEIEDYPVIIAIFGSPGMGKTWQLRTCLKLLDVDVFSVNSADLESQLAGLPAKILKEQYINASYNIANGKPSAIVIDDIDTTVGEWEKNTGTVNHQGILAFLMHIADNPYYIETVGNIKRVPIFVTGNNFSLLYEPLRRPGRTKHFAWAPTREEKLEVLSDIFHNQDIAERALIKYPDQPISFFSDLVASQHTKELSSIASNAVFKYVLSNVEYKERMKKEYQDKTDSIDWQRIL